MVVIQRNAKVVHSQPRAGASRHLDPPKPFHAMAPKKVKATSPGGKLRSVQGRVQAWVVLLIWAPAIFYRERLAFSLAGASCQWPSLDGSDGAQSTGDPPPVRIAVVADPQLTTHLSYRELGRGTMGLTAVEGISDAYMSRAFRKAVLTNDPDHVLFLGDLIDQGENIVDPAEWHEARRRFDRIFRWPRDDPSGDKDDGAGVDDARGISRRMSYLTVHGNHDVGYSRFAARYGAVHARHEQHFGSTNFVRRVGGVDLVGVGAMALDGAEDPGAASVETKETWAFVESLYGDDEGSVVDGEERDGVEEGDGVEGRCVGEPPRPRVLVTHVPLSKRSYEPGSCGNQRGSPVIRDKTHMNVTVAGRRREIPRHDGLGCRYQDYLRPETSRQVLHAVRPTLVLSGHDHDQCVGTHDVFEKDAKGHVCGTGGTGRFATEHTIGSFSFLMGNPRPTFAMVSFVNGERECGDSSAGFDLGHTCPAGSGGIHGEAAAKVSLCYLPSQWNTAWVYIALGGVTAVASVAGIVADARRGVGRMRAAARGAVATLGTCAVVAGLWAGLLLADLSAP